MNKYTVCLAMFILLVSSALIVLAEDNVSNDTQPVYEGLNLSNETIVTEPVPEAEPSLICNETVCMEGCVLCSDNKCHEPDFVCKEELAVEKISPTTVSIGVNQINILLRNTGNVDLSNISVDLSGDGISVIEKTPIEKLAAGDKDYAFVKTSIAKAGVIDLVVKIYLSSGLKYTLVNQLTVLEEKVNKTSPEVNLTGISDSLKSLKERYIDIEQDYQNKKLQGYPVDIVYDKLKETESYIKEAQFYLVEEDGYKKAQLDLKIIEDNLNEIENDLKESKKQQQSFGDKLKGNMIYIGSIAAAIVSLFTAWGLIKSSINKQKIAELQKKIIKEKKELKEEKEEIHQEKEELQEIKEELKETPKVSNEEKENTK